MADLTVRDVLALPEVASYREPTARPRAARLAPTGARRNSFDTRDPAWAHAQDLVQHCRQPHDDLVVDCDGTVWERYPDERDLSGPLPADRWSPRRRTGEPPDDRS